MTFLTSVHTLVPGSHPASGASDPAEHDAWPQQPSSHTKCLHVTEAKTQISKEPLNSCTKHIITKLNAQHISVTQKCKRISRIPALLHPKNSHALARTQWVQVPVNLQRRQKCIHVLCSFEVKSSHNRKDVEEYAHPNVPHARFACLAGKSS